jgi:DNA invertase Pin-like site-specific DNA recombinase
VLDRLFRDAEDALRQTKGWGKAGIALLLLDMRGTGMNTASAMAHIFLTLMARCAELERNLVAESTASALAHRKQQGRAAIGS